MLQGIPLSQKQSGKLFQYQLVNFLVDIHTHVLEGLKVKAVSKLNNLYKRDGED